MNRTKQSRGPFLWPVVITLVGVVLLLHNFLLFGEFDVLDLWPLLLVIAGAQILLRGDLLPGSSTGTFGITRGSVESATLEISSGEIDVELRALQREGRLIAGQYAHLSRPQLTVHENHAHLRMTRSGTPWLSFADWEIGLARDLPWQVLISTYLGQVNVDLSNLVINGVVIATGIGDVRLVCPYETFAPLFVRSSLGNVHIATPPGHRVRITVGNGRFFHVNADENRYEFDGEAFVSRDATDDAPLVEVNISGTFGDAFLT